MKASFLKFSDRIARWRGDTDLWLSAVVVAFTLFLVLVAIFARPGASCAVLAPKRELLRFEGCGAKKGLVVVDGARVGDSCEAEGSAVACEVVERNTVAVSAVDSDQLPCVIVSRDKVR